MSDEAGMGLIELVIAMIVITVALLALMAGYDAAALSLNKSARTSAAAQLAETQLELMGALPYAGLGLNSTLLSTAKSGDPYYSTDEATLSPAGTDVTNASCDTTSAQCLPVQASVMGSNHLNYRVETFVRDVTQTLVPSGTTTEREVTVVIRDPNTTGTPKVFTATGAFDQGPRS